MSDEEFCMEIPMISAASDVWIAITAATAIFPRAMPDLYEKIEVVRRDGFTTGSRRTITFGHAYRRVAKTATEEILLVDQAHMRIKSTFTNDGGFVSDLFESFDITITVVPSNRDLTLPGCTVKWEATYYQGNGFGADIETFKRRIKEAYQELEKYLRTARGVRQ